MSPRSNKGPIIAGLVLLGLILLVLLMPRGREEGDAKLTIISPHSNKIKDEFKAAFADWSEQNLGERVIIDWLDPGGSVSQQRYVLERFEENPEGIGVDLFFGGGVDPYLRFKREGYLATVELPPEVLDRIPQQKGGMEMYDADLQWFGACMAGFGIIYNEYVLEQQEQPVPQTWLDLARPGLFSYVSAADPRKSGSMHMAYEIMMQALGWEKGWSALARITANCHSLQSAAGDVISVIEAGNAGAGMAIDYYALEAQSSNRRVGFALPEGLTVINPDGIGVLKGAPQMEYAQAFVRFVLSDAGQKLWILKAGAPGGPREGTLFRMPMVPGFAEQFEDAARTRDAFDFEVQFEFDSEKKNKRWSIINDLFGAYFVDTHDELATAWKSVMNLPGDNQRRRALLAPPMTEQELMDLIPRWDSPSFRTETVDSWRADARDRYESIAGSD